MLTIFAISIFLLTYTLRIFEIRYTQCPATDVQTKVEGSFFSSLYAVIITMTTVGYGDLTPRT